MVKVQAPVESAATVPSFVAPSNTVTVLLASAVPFKTSALGVLAGADDTIFGATGATVSTVTENAADVSVVVEALV